MNMLNLFRTFPAPDRTRATGLRKWLLLIVTVSVCTLIVRPATANNWALLIGIQDVDSKNWDSLPFTKNDVNDLKNVLVERGNYGGRVTSLLNKNREGLSQGIRDFFKQHIEPGDLVMLYYTGHGYTANEQLYFVPTDFDEQRPEATGIDVGELREQLKNCPATNKVFIIDACHAGTQIAAKSNALTSAEKKTRNDSSDTSGGLTDDLAKAALDSVAVAKGATAGQVRDAFRGNSGVVLLASSQGTQSSYPMKDNKHSLFSFWLIEGLKGHADKDSNGSVTIDEVNEFVGSYVSDSAKYSLDEKQNPVREIGVDVPNDQPMVLSKLKERRADDLLKDMAELIGRVVSLKGIGPVTVCPDFATWKVDTGDVNLVPERKPLSKQFAFKLDQAMQIKAEKLGFHTYQFATFVDEQLKTKGNRATSIEDPKKLVLVHGFLKQLSGNFVDLRAEAYLLGNDGAMVQVATAGGRTSLSDETPGPKSNQSELNEFPATGRSAIAEPGDLSPIRVAGKDISGVAAANERWNSPERLTNHPLEDSTFAFPIKIKSRELAGGGEWRVKKPYFEGNDAYVELNPGEEYGIEIENRYDSPNRDQVLVKILVDGLSIFDQPPPTGFVTAKDKGRTKVVSKDIAASVMKVAHASSIADASAWPLADDRETFYRGFYLGTGGDYCPFEVVDSSDSWAAQRGMDRSIGYITVIFYKDSGISLGPGTRGGSIVRGPDLETVPIGKAGETLAFVNIRYVSRSELQQIKQRSRAR